MSSSRPHSGIHCLNCDLWDSRISMIFRSHCPDRDSTPCFGLEQASMSKSQHGLVGAELNARARGTVPEYMWLPDNRKALDGLWELSIIVPIAAFSRHAMLRGSRRISDPSAALRVTVGWVGVQGVQPRLRQARRRVCVGWCCATQHD